MKQSQKIAVLGGTGRTGGFLLSALISRDYNVKALARDPGKLKLSGPMIEVIKGDARDYRSVYDLLNGCEAVISTLGPSPKEPDTCSIAAGHIIRAMQELNMERYIEVAGLAMDIPGDKKGILIRSIISLMKLFSPAITGDRQKDYELLAASQLNWTIVRCPMIKMSPVTGSFKTSITDSPGIGIRSADLAMFLIDQLSDNRFIRKAPFVAN